MAHHERYEKFQVRQFVPLGCGVNYITETGQICIGEKQVTKLGFQANIIFQRLTATPGWAVNRLALAMVGGLVETEYFSYSDEHRVSSTINRIRKKLTEINPILANNLVTVYLYGYRWDYTK